MTEVQTALEAVLASASLLPVQQTVLSKATGRILRQEIRADRDLPPFDRVSMDGIAVAWPETQAPRRFELLSTQYAGEAPHRLDNPQGCIEVMTGGVLPKGADTVIRYEDLEFSETNGRRYVTLRDVAVKKGQNVHRQGRDHRQGETLIAPGARIGPAEIAIAASAGYTRLRVSRLPRIALLSTGNELVFPPAQPAPWQIRSSNVPMLKAALAQLGITAGADQLPDDKDVMSRALPGLLTAKDALICSGAVSAGKADFLPAALEDAGVECIFHKVSQRPGKPFWFGRHPDGCVVFAFPGNPVSAFMCFYKYFVPWLRAKLGAPEPAPCYARLSKAVEFKPSLSYFLQVQVEFQADGTLIANPLPGGGSGDYANLHQTNAFLELPSHLSTFGAGTAWPLIGYGASDVF